MTINSDITRLGVGARPLGMGKTFTGLADDISSLYMNPGGLGRLSEFQVLSMSGKFANLANYLTLAGTLPTKLGTFGLGYAGLGMGFTTPALDLVEIATGEYRVIPSTNETTTYNYNNYSIALAYGTPLLRPDLTLGANFKLFTENISGTGSAKGNGYDMDLGLLFVPNSTLSLGLMARNIIPSSMGGKITWDTGQTAALPASYILGSNLKLIPPKEIGSLNIAADYEYKPTQASLWHLGLEWWPIPLFALRGGMDQDVVGNAVNAESLSNNVTAGMSLNFSGLRFDYAFHQYNQTPSNDTHFFSIVYAQQPSKRIPMFLLSPKDKTVTDSPSIKVEGLIKDSDVTVVRVNNRTIIPITGKSKSLEADVPLEIGKNTIWVSSYGRDGKLIESRRIRILRLMSFTDVGPSFWAKDPIEQTATVGILAGFPNGKFKPQETLKRSHMVTKLVQISKMITDESSVTPFKDVRKGRKDAPYVRAGYNNRLVYGYPDKTFKPSKTTDMIEAIMMTVRYAKLQDTTVLERPYDDVSGRHWGIKEITIAKQNNLLNFIGSTLGPKKAFNRAEFAAMLSQTPPVKAQIDELLDFESGYQLNFPY